MVKYNAGTLDNTFAALADPTRRALVEQVCANPGLSVSDLARPHRMSLPAIMKHLEVLSDAGLVVRTKSGRTVNCQLRTVAMQEAMSWLDRYARFWSQQLDRLALFVEEEKTCSTSPQPSKSRASRSSAGSRPVRKRSTMRGRSPRN